MRSPATAMDPYPLPRFWADQTTAGPFAGHAFSSPVSFESAVRSGLCQCGQSKRGAAASRAAESGAAASRPKGIAPWDRARATIAATGSTRFMSVLLASGFRLSAFGFRLLAFGFWLLAFGF